MKQAIVRKLNNHGGTRWVIAAALAVVVVLLVILLIPAVRDWLGFGAANGCDLALRRTRDTLRYEYLLGANELDKSLDLERAQQIVREKGSFCPGGGEFYVIQDPDDPTGIDIVCGLHDSDRERRTRLNGENALAQIRAVLAEEKRLAHPAPDAVEVTLNSETYTAERRDAVPSIRHGTYVTAGFDGIFICYMLDDGGELSWFCYADADHCVRWRAAYGWIPEGAE